MNDFIISDKIKNLAKETQKRCAALFMGIDANTEVHQRRVLKAFCDNRVSEAHFAPSTGYGYGDRGREVLDRLWADVLGCEDALIRYSFASGTHALCVMLFGVLRPGDTVLCVTGTPYDTIHSVFGIQDKTGTGSLADFGVRYRQVDLTDTGEVDLDGIRAALRNEPVRAVYIQRSRGYTLRPSLTVQKINEIAKLVREESGALVLLDNCYGEFVETVQPGNVDLLAGSLIKNPGGGIARCGGYIAGKKEYVELCAYRMTSPGLGREVGATLGHNRDIFMGIFHAPHVTGEALKTAVFAAALFEQLGFSVSPRPFDERADIIQSILLKSPERLVAFCRGLQSGSPVDSFVVPEASDMPGYDSKVIMAAGAFTLGSSIELSADAPLREPYAVWLQGGLNFHSAKVGLLLAADRVLECGE